MEDSKILRRYTDLPSAIHILKTQELTLLSPFSWDDRNDRHFMSTYAKRRSIGTVHALCFTQAGETYHHWKIFSPGNSGVCLEFNRQALIAAIPKYGYRSGDIEYSTIPKAKQNRVGEEMLPFTKRYAFKDEKEFRILHSSDERGVPTVSFRIPTSAIERVILSPWLPESLFTSIWELLKGIDACGSITISRSHLVESEAWKRVADDA